MNRSHIRPIVVSLTAAAALTLTACGGGDGDSGNDKIAGAEDSAKKESASPAQKADKAADIDRPEMTFPSDVKLVFDKANLGDQDQIAALNDARNYARAIEHGIVEQDADDAAYKFYSEYGSPAYTYAKDQIKKHIDAGYTVTGERRYTKPKVQTVDKKKTIAVTFCTNDNKLFGKEVKGGKVLRTEPSLKDYSYWQISMSAAKNTKGLWRADLVKVESEAQQCQ
ncbi:MULTISPECIES: hypothetical protein [unclassified Streptomyces]|uniref:hypothetical protein n=1 Tax=unclassified Streptomyces TaxID=2593676 RepID=UPI0007491C1A|nr:MULTISPECIES: hypothetical protein [unclassified Streptomyces]KUL54732.1 hypothetical protein ADL30_15425 [Streptomyces sp. NRRL S-1521]THC53374.1 hypothetical protein E7X58_09090 [Streptomyces sp. A1499]